MILYVLSALAGSDFRPVVTDLGGGAHVDWSAVTLVVEAETRRSGSEGNRAVEELARRRVDDRVRPATLEVAMAPNRRIGDLEDSRELWPSVDSRRGRWVESENRYYSSGRIGVQGTLSLVDLLKPVTMAVARAREVRDAGEAAVGTGAIVDARSVLGIVPCFSPRITDASGSTLYAGELWLDAAVDKAPAVWVSDAAHPAARRAGDAPVMAIAVGGAGCEIAVDVAGAASIRALARSPVLRDGTLVVIVDSH